MPDTKSPLLSRRRILGAAGLAAGAAATSALGMRPAFATDYPDRTIKIIVPFAPAGPTDIMARILAQNLGPALGGNVIVENRPGAGTTPHLSAELLKIVGGVEITHVPFSGAAPAIQALLAGTTQLAVTALPAALPFVQSGEIKALALTGEHRWPDLPEVPTMIELGYRDFIAETAQFFFAPAKTPPGIVERLAAKSIELLKVPAIVAQLRDNGYEVVTHGPEGLRKYIETEVPKWRDVIAKAGIKPV